MKIEVSKNKKIKAIQDEFQEVFPFLKLVFYSNSHKTGEGSIKKFTISNDATVSETSKKETDSTLTINKSMKVSELENAFLDSFGLNVQVFRKSNNLWLQTTITDNWSLEKQNQNGKEMNTQESIIPEKNDFREQK